MSNSSRRPLLRQVPSPGPGAAPPMPPRFIPKEELTGYAAWQPGPLGLGVSDAGDAGMSVPPQGGTQIGTQIGTHIGTQGAPLATAHRAAATQASSVAPTIAAQTGPTPAEIEALQQAARQAGYHDGYRDGLAALESFKRSFAQQITGQIGALVRSMETQLDALDAEMAQAVLRAGVGLARQVVRSEIQARPELVAQVARDAVSAITIAARQIELSVHPDDLPLVESGLADLREGRGIVLLTDADLGRGGCRLRSDVGSVDAAIEVRWSQALQQLGLAESAWPLLTGSPHTDQERPG